jgi:kynureninase
MNFENTLAFAQALDQQDKLHSFRSKYLIPKHEGLDAIYLCGNSLGLQPKACKDYILEQLDNWEEYGVEGHFKTNTPWMYYQKTTKDSLAKLIGATTNEVVAMNQLTVNLHLMFVSFYRPTATRYKIIMEAGAFPSDQYAVESQVRYHGFEPADAIVELSPRQGEYTLREEDILESIAKHGDSVALVMMGGVNYYTGQFYPLEKICAAAHAIGAYCGFDLAHTIGNIPLKLHDWKVDFAVWCSYKYLNSSPGGISGIFIHEKHSMNPATPRFAGWWGYQEDTRFLMKKGFIPEPGAEGWQMSNVPVLSMAAHKASLDLFEEAGIGNLREKSLTLTAYMEFIIDQVNLKIGHEKFIIITPRDPKQRGAQLSIICKQGGRQVFDELTKNGVIGDWREPEVLRFAPVPMYNSFEDVYRFGQVLLNN